MSEEFTRYTEDAFIPMTWEKYQQQVEILVPRLKDLHVNFDFIVPVMRGGMPLAISLSERLNVQRIMPVQYRWDVKLINGKRKKECIPVYSSIPSIEDKYYPYNILITEANCCTGETAQRCISHIKEELPNCHIYYVSIGRDYSHKGKFVGADYETWTFLTNESGVIKTTAECEQLGIINKFTLYPWETIEGELRDMNGD